MYRRMLLTIILSLLAFSVFANFETSFGLKSSKPSSFDKSLSGIELSLGKKYLMLENFGMKTAFEFSYVGKTYDIGFAGQKVAEYKAKEYSYGLLQRFYYDLPTTSLVFTPFVDLGFGYVNIKDELKSVFVDTEKHSDSSFYYKYDLGFQLLSLGGVGGELKWGQSKNKEYKSNFAVVSFIYNFSI